MPQINPSFRSTANELIAMAYAQNIDCPPLRPLAKWLLDQDTANVTMARTGTAAANDAASFDDAALAAIASSPNGVSLTDLAPILKHYGRPANQIGAALARLSKQTKIEKRGELWHLAGAKTGAASGQTRRGRGRPRTARAGNGSQQQPGAAAE